MATIRSLEIEIKAKTNNARAQMLQLQKQIDDLKTVTNKMSRQLKKAGVEVDSAGNKMRKSSKDVKKFGDNFAVSSKNIGGFLVRLNPAVVAATSLAFAMGAVGKSVLDTGLELDSLKRSLVASTGSAEKANFVFTKATEVSMKYGLELQGTVRGLNSFMAATKGSAIEGRASIKIFESLAQAARVYGMSQENVNGILTALSQISSKGVVMMEELKSQLGDRLAGTLALAAKAMGVTRVELFKMVEMGQVSAEEFLPKFAEALRESTAASAELAAASPAASINRLGTTLTLLRDTIANEGGVLSFTGALADSLSEMGMQFVSIERLTKGYAEARLKQARADLAEVQSKRDLIKANNDYAESARNALAGKGVELPPLLNDDGEILQELKIQEEIDRLINRIEALRVAEESLDGKTISRFTATVQSAVSAANASLGEGLTSTNSSLAAFKKKSDLTSGKIAETIMTNYAEVADAAKAYNDAAQSGISGTVLDVLKSNLEEAEGVLTSNLNSQRVFLEFDAKKREELTLKANADELKKLRAKMKEQFAVMESASSEMSRLIGGDAFKNTFKFEVDKDFDDAQTVKAVQESYDRQLQAADNHRISVNTLLDGMQLEDTQRILAKEAAEEQHTAAIAELNNNLAEAKTKALKQEVDDHKEGLKEMYAEALSASDQFKAIIGGTSFKAAFEIEMETDFGDEDTNSGVESLYQDRLRVIEEFYAKKKDILATALEDERITETDFSLQSAALREQENEAEFEQLKAFFERKKELSDAEKQIKMANVEEFTGLSVQSQEALSNFETMSQEEKVKTAAKAGKEVLGGLAKHSKAAFEVQKAMKIGETIINTRSAAMGAYNALASIPYVGPALGVAAAAAAIASGAKQISAIKSQRFGGGGSVGASVGSTGSTNAATSATSGLAAQSQNEVTPTTVQDVSINVNGKIFDRETVIEIIDGINEAVDDNVIIRAA